MIKKFFLLMVLLVSWYVHAMDFSYPEHGMLIAEAFQSEAVLTKATDPKPMVATGGCGPCVAFGGYDNINRIAFMVHFATAEEVCACGNMIIDTILLHAPRKLTAETPLVIHLRGGVKGMSEITIAAIKFLMKYRRDLPMVLGSEDTLRFAVDGKSLLIDSRTGAIGDYDFTLNPHARKYLDSDKRHAESSYYVPHINMAYVPQG